MAIATITVPKYASSLEGFGFDASEHDVSGKAVIIDARLVEVATPQYFVELDRKLFAAGAARLAILTDTAPGNNSTVDLALGLASEANEQFEVNLAYGAITRLRNLAELHHVLEPEDFAEFITCEL